MAYIELDKDKLHHNYKFLDDLFKDHNIEWAPVLKMLCGNELYLKEFLSYGPKEVCDARISNLRRIKEINPDVETVYIKPPAKSAVPDVVKYADASFNSEFDTIEALSLEAGKQGKKHKVIIMIELGDLREGVMGEDLMDFYESVFELPDIEVTGLGTNLNCVSGVYPSEDKLIQLCLYEQLIEARFERSIPWLTGGTSIVIPLLMKSQVPDGINHFRVGETLFFGNDLFSEEIIPGMHGDLFKLYAEIIEINEKPIVPVGYMAENPSGEMVDVHEDDYGKLTYRALIDVGVLDIAKSDFLIPEDSGLEIIGASSDMLVLDLGESKQGYEIGDIVSFKLKYMGALRLLNSDYIEKRFVGGE